MTPCTQAAIDFVRSLFIEMSLFPRFCWVSFSRCVDSPQVPLSICGSHLLWYSVCNSSTLPIVHLARMLHWGGVKGWLASLQGVENSPPCMVIINTQSWLPNHWCHEQVVRGQLAPLEYPWFCFITCSPPNAMHIWQQL